MLCLVISIRMHFSDLSDFTDERKEFFYLDNVVSSPVVGSELSEDVLIKNREVFTSYCLVKFITG